MITDALLALGADALRAEAGRRRRAAELFAGEIRDAKLAGELKDVRTQAVKVLDLLGEASGLEQLAQVLAELLTVDDAAELLATLDLDDVPPAPEAVPRGTDEPDPDIVAARSLLLEDEPPLDPIELSL